MADPIVIDATVTSFTPHIQSYLSQISASLANGNVNTVTGIGNLMPAYLTLHDDDSDLITDIKIRDLGTYIGGANLYIDNSDASDLLLGNRVPTEYSYNYNAVTKTHSYSFTVEFGTEHGVGTINKLRLWVDSSQGDHTKVLRKPKDYQTISTLNIFPNSTITGYSYRIDSSYSNYLEGYSLLEYAISKVYRYKNSKILTTTNNASNGKLNLNLVPVETNLNSFALTPPSLYTPPKPVELELNLTPTQFKNFGCIDMDEANNVFVFHANNTDNTVSISRYNYTEELGFSVPVTHIINIPADTDDENVYSHSVGGAILRNDIASVGCRLSHYNWWFARINTITGETIESIRVKTKHNSYNAIVKQIGFSEELNAYIPVVQPRKGSDLYLGFTSVIAISRDVNLSLDYNCSYLGEYRSTIHSSTYYTGDIQNIFNHEGRYSLTGWEGIHFNSYGSDRYLPTIGFDTGLASLIEIPKGRIYEYTTAMLPNSMLAEVKIDPIIKTDQHQITIKLNLNVTESNN